MMTVKRCLMFGSIFGLASAFAGTGTIEVAATNYLDSAAQSVTVRATGAATNGVWVAWDEEDRGASTNGWANVRFVGTVTSAAASLEYPLPEGWGTTGKKAMRFFLSEVPYDVDCTLEYITGDGNSYFDTGYTPTGKAKVVMDFETPSPLSKTVAYFCARESASKDQFTLLSTASSSTTPSRWRFDYNTNTGSSTTPTLAPAKSKRYLAEVSSDGLFTDGNLAQKTPAAAYTGACGGSLFIFALASKSKFTSGYCPEAKLYSFKLYPDKGSSALQYDFIPVVKGGKVGLFNRVDGEFLASSGTGAFAKGPRKESADPFFAATGAVGIIPAATDEELLNNSGWVVITHDITVAGKVLKTTPSRLVFMDNTVTFESLELFADVGADVNPVITFSNSTVTATATEGDGLTIRQGCVELADGSTYTVRGTVHVGVGADGVNRVARLEVRDSTLDAGENMIYMQNGSTNDNQVRFMVYGAGSIIKAKQFSVSRGEIQIYGGTVTLTDDKCGVMLGGGTEACRLYGGTLETKGVQCNGTGSAFEWRGGAVKLLTTKTVDTFFLGTCSKTRVTQDGGVFDTGTRTASITNALVKISSDKSTAYSRAKAMSVPAFRKDGSGVLGLSKPCTYVCATELHEGSLKLKYDGALPDTGLLRLTGGTLDVNALERTVGNLVGHGGINSSATAAGTLTVTGEIVPMDGNIWVRNAKLVGKVCLTVAADGTLPAVLEARTALDLSGVDLVVENAAKLPEAGRVLLVSGAVSEPPKSVTGLPEGWHVSVTSKGVSASNLGLTVIVK